MRTSRTVPAAVAVAAAMMLIAPSAEARIVSNEHFSFTETHIEQEEHGADFCQNVEFLVRYDVEASGHTLIKTKADNPFPYFAETHRFDESYTNIENGKSLRLISSGRNADQSIVDNGDGTITIRFMDVGVQRVYGPDGKLLFVDAGMFGGEVVIDYNGTPEDPEDDTEVSFEVIKEVGHFGTEGRDFCEDLVTFLG